MKKRKIAAILMSIFVLAGMLSGCAGQSGTPDESAKGTVEAQEETTDTAEEATATEKETDENSEVLSEAGSEDTVSAAEPAAQDSMSEDHEETGDGAETAEENTAAGGDDPDNDEAEAGSEEAADAVQESQEAVEQSAEPAVSGERKRRELPHQESVDQEKLDSVTAFEDTTKRPEKITGPSVMFVEAQKAAEKKLKWKDDSFPDSEEDVQHILGDLMNYWDSYNMDAVDYLVRMEKYRYLSQMLSGTREYFYCGETNKDGEPEGKGIAVYAGNQYYFGNFVNGERSGDGYWYQIFERDGEYSKNNYGIYVHSYSGQWEHDLPNGGGQEHISLDTQYLTKRICTNVVGTFKDGYYDGEEIVTSLDENNNFINWKGTAIKGAWAPISSTLIRNADGEKEFAALQSYENKDDYFWMLSSENSGQGVAGLVPVNYN